MKIHIFAEKAGFLAKLRQNGAALRRDCAERKKTDVKKFTFRKKKFIMVASGKKEPP